MFRKIILLFALCYSCCIHVQAQGDTLVCEKSCCCSSDPTPSGVMISHVHEKGQWMISYRFMNMNMKGVNAGSEHIDQAKVFIGYLMAPEKMRMDMHMMMGMYGLSSRVTVMAMVNYLSVSMNMVMFGGGGHNHYSADGNSASSHGIGDSKAFVLYGLINTPRTQLILNAGLGLPTGNIFVKGSSYDIIYPDERLPYAMQLGSGSFEVLPGLTYLFQVRKITTSIQVSGNIRTNYNEVGYKLGNELMSNTWLAYRWTKSFSSSIRIETAIAEQIKGMDPYLYHFTEPAANPSNYGGKHVFGYLGSVYQIKKGHLNGMKIAAEYGVPVYNIFNGLQMGVKNAVNVSLSYTF